MEALPLLILTVSGVTKAFIFVSPGHSSRIAAKNPGCQESDAESLEDTAENQSCLFPDRDDATYAMSLCPDCNAESAVLSVVLERECSN